MSHKLKCNKCNKLLPLTSSYFHWRNDIKSWRKTCKECVNSSRRKGNIKYVVDQDIYKIECTKCKKLFPRTKKFFPLRSKDKLRRSCRNCERLKYHSNKDRFKKAQKKYYKKNRNKILSKQKQYIKNNKKIINKKRREYYHSNKERCIAINNESRINHRDSINRKKRLYEKKRRLKDPAYKLRRNISRSISAALKKEGFSKNGSSIINALSYTIDELKNHLELQFDSWMNWNNYGIYKKIDWNDNDQSTWTWNIDHIIPQSKLLYNSMNDRNFFKCWDLNNLRPLSSKENLLKKDKIKNQ